MRKIKIEDFHIGFEYEEYVHNPGRYLVKNDSKIWVKRKYGFGSPKLHKMVLLIDSGVIRKHKKINTIDKKESEPKIDAFGWFIILLALFCLLWTTIN